jgi:hypothetical protein
MTQTRTLDHSAADFLAGLLDERPARQQALRPALALAAAPDGAGCWLPGTSPEDIALDDDCPRRLPSLRDLAINTGLVLLLLAGLALLAVMLLAALDAQNITHSLSPVSMSRIQDMADSLVALCGNIADAVAGTGKGLVVLAAAR